MRSGFLKLHLWDFIKGLIVAILTGIMTFLSTYLQTGTEVNENLWAKVGIAGLISLLAYLLKNLFTNNKDQFLTKDKK